MKNQQPDSAFCNLDKRLRKLEDLSQVAISKIDRLSVEIAQLRSTKGLSSSIPRQQPKTLFHFTRTGLERKPFCLSMSGYFEGMVNLSDVRASIFFVLLIDMQDRAEGGSGIQNPQKVILEVLRRIAPRLEDTSMAERLRVALYRLDKYLAETTIFKSKRARLQYNPEAVRFVLAPESLEIKPEVTYTDRELAECADELFTTSPLERLRRAKSFYIPPGPKGMDRLLLEFYEQPEVLEVRSMYFRPAQVNWPKALLEHCGASKWLLRRQELATERLSGGSAKFAEVLTEDSIRALTRRDNIGRFSAYPCPVSSQQVVEHFDHLIWKLRNMSNYEIAIIGFPPPMYLVGYQIGLDKNRESPSFESSSSMERFVACFQQVPVGGQFEDVSTYVINDPVVFDVLARGIIDGVVAHPSTLVDREAVIGKLLEIKATIS
jgi:hypothetical protein